jgi:hypothetical protein
MVVGCLLGLFALGIIGVGLKIGIEKLFKVNLSGRNSRNGRGY